MKATKPTFSGPQPINVGGAVFGVPRGSRVAHAQGQPSVIYVLLPGDGTDIRCLCPRGEVAVPSRLREGLRRRYFN